MADDHTSKPADSSRGGETTPVALTARWIAAARAHESARPDRLFDDPFAAALAGSRELGLSAAGALRAGVSVVDQLIVQASRAFGVPSAVGPMSR